MTDEINTDRSPDATYRNKTDADSAEHGVEGQDFYMCEIAGGRIGVWHRKSEDRFAPCITLTTPDREFHKGKSYCFPTIADAKDYAREEQLSDFTIEGES